MQLVRECIHHAEVGASLANYHLNGTQITIGKCGENLEFFVLTI